MKQQMKTETVKDNEKGEIGPGAPPPWPVPSLTGKGLAEEEICLLELPSDERRRRACPWLSLDAQSPSERILRNLPRVSPVLKAGSSVRSASPSSKALVTFHRSELSQEGVPSVAVSVPLKGPQ